MGGRRDIRLDGATAVDRRPDQTGRDIEAVVGDDVDRRHQLDAGAGDTLAVAHGHLLGALQFGPVMQDARRLPGEPERGHRPEAEEAHVVPVLRATGRLLDVDRADVRRLDEDPADAHLLIGMLVGVLQQILAVLAAPGDDEGGVLGDGPLVQTGCDRDHLGHRAGLVGVDCGQVARCDPDLPRLGLALDGGHGEEVTRIGVHHDALAGLGPDLIDLRNNNISSIVFY